MPRASIQWTEEETRAAEDGGDEVQTSFSELVFDAVTAQARDLVTELPEHPVEGGAAATDHAIPQPRRVSFEAHIATAVHSIELSSGASRRTTDVGGADARVIGADSPADRAADALSQLQDLIDRGVEVDILGLPYGDLEGYQLASISIAQDPGTGAQLVPMIEARQRITASSSEVEAPAPRVERTRRQRQRGTQSTTETSSTSDTRSRAAQLLDAVGAAARGN